MLTHYEGAVLYPSDSMSGRCMTVGVDAPMSMPACGERPASRQLSRLRNVRCQLRERHILCKVLNN